MEELLMLKHGNIILRALRNSDKDFLYKSINSPELVRYNAPYAPIHELNHEEWFQQILKDPRKRLFMIETEDHLVGTIQLFDINLVHRNAELSIRIVDAKDRGKGIGNKAVFLLTEHAFKDLGLKRVWLRVFNNNSPAIKSYEKAGFTKEGVLRKTAFIDGQFLDMVVMAKLANDAI